MDGQSWKARAQAEIARAEAARRSGNEGMARVCARRSAGHIIGEYLARRDITTSSPSAFVRLQHLQTLPDVSDRVRAVAGHFTLRITEEHTLPVEADLIAEVRWLARELLGAEL